MTINCKGVLWLALKFLQPLFWALSSAETQTVEPAELSSIADELLAAPANDLLSSDLADDVLAAHVLEGVCLEGDPTCVAPT